MEEKDEALFNFNPFRAGWAESERLAEWNALGAAEREANYRMDAFLNKAFPEA